MADIYLYADVPVLKNKLDIKDEKTLDFVEAEQSRANMMLLYEQGLDDFSADGLCSIHRFLFGDIYEWAGQYRLVNIEKREELLAGRSVWYSNDDDIQIDLDAAFKSIHSISWDELAKIEFVQKLARYFSKVWQVHPFREGNTRAVVMMLTLFVEAHGYYMDQELMAASAGYVRNSFVMASLDQFSEFEHLERILMDAVCEEPVVYGIDALDASNQETERQDKYKKYQTEKYVPQPHYVREDRALEERLAGLYGKPIEQIEQIQGDGEIDWGEASGHEVW